MIDVDPKASTLKGIHIFKKNYKSQMSRCSLWGVEVHPYPALRKKMIEFMHRKQMTATPYTNETYQPKWKKTPRKRNLVQFQDPVEANS